MKRDNTDGSRTYYGTPDIYVTLRDGEMWGVRQRRRDRDKVTLVCALVFVFTLPVWVRWVCLLIVELAPSVQ